jgi:hypothetical protein
VLYKSVRYGNFAGEARHGMDVITTAIPDILIIEPEVHGDQRGFFFETFKADRYAVHGIVGPFVPGQSFALGLWRAARAASAES